MNTMARSTPMAIGNSEGEKALTPEQEKALMYLEGRRNSARKRVERIELALDYIDGDTHNPEMAETLGVLAQKTVEELEALHESASAWVGGISRTMTEVEDGNLFLAMTFSNLETELERNQATRETE